MAASSENGSDRAFLVEFAGGILTVIPLGDFDSFRWPEMEAASMAIFESIRRDPDAKVLVDMGRLRYCGSAMLGILLKVWKTVSPRSGVLAFCNLNAEVTALLHQTRLDTLWTVYTTREEALAALQIQGA